MLVGIPEVMVDCTCCDDWPRSKNIDNPDKRREGLDANFKKVDDTVGANTGGCGGPSVPLSDKRW